MSQAKRFYVDADPWWACEGEGCEGVAIIAENCPYCERIIDTNRPPTGYGFRSAVMIDGEWDSDAWVPCGEPNGGLNALQTKTEPSAFQAWYDKHKPWSVASVDLEYQGNEDFYHWMSRVSWDAGVAHDNAEWNDLHLKLEEELEQERDELRAKIDAAKAVLPDIKQARKEGLVGWAYQMADALDQIRALLESGVEGTEE
jgi:hypothetical protein